MEYSLTLSVITQKVMNLSINERYSNETLENTSIIMTIGHWNKLLQKCHHLHHFSFKTSQTNVCQDWFSYSLSCLAAQGKYQLTSPSPLSALCSTVFNFCHSGKYSGHNTVFTLWYPMFFMNFKC